MADPGMIKAIFEAVPPSYISTAALLVVIYWLFRDRTNLVDELKEVSGSLNRLVKIVDVLVSTGNNQRD